MTKKILCVLLSVLVCSSYLSYIPVKASNNSSLLYGDVNQDETVEVKDLVRLKSNILNSKDYVEEGDLDKDTDNDSNDVTLLRKMLVGSFAGIDEITIVGHDVLGDWADDEIAPDGTAETNGPSLCYDDNEDTRWNPQANSYNDNVGIEFTLDGYYDLRTLELVCGGREYYFDVYTSTYGKSWDQIMSITSENYSDYYSKNENENFVCTLKDLLAEDVHYVKVLVNGNTSSNNLWWQFKEISMYGLKQEVPVAEIPIETHEVSGWTTDNEGSTSLGPQISYDGSYDTTKWWQAQAASNWANNPSIIYELDGYYDLSEVVIDVIKRAYYFDLSVSTDGNTWETPLSVTADNYSTYYTEIDGSTYNADSDGAKRCKYTFADAEAVKYVKLTMTGCSESNLYYGLIEIDMMGTKVKAPTMDLEIIDNEVSSTGWSKTQEGSSSLGPEKSYDGDLNTNWNPQATDTSYSDDPSIVYTLKSVYDLDKIQITTGNRAYYFDLYVSEDGTGWTKELSITNAERASYYKNADGTAYTTDITNKLCTIAFPEIVKAKYIKIVFTGAAANTSFVVVKEVEVYGKDLHEDFSFSVSGAFSSNMVLQRNEPISVWGWADEGNMITGVFAGSAQSVVAGADGAWKLTFPAQQVNVTPQSMTISCGSSTVEFDNILIGDVYLVSGQSNAELSVSRTAAHLDDAGKEEVKELFRSDDKVRIFLQTKSYVVDNEVLWSTPQKDVINPDWCWQVASEEDAFWDFSALGCYFAKTLRDSLDENIPIGMVQMAVGGAFLDELMPTELNEKFGYTVSHTVSVGGYYNTMMHPFVGIPVAGMLFYQGESNNFSYSDNYARDLKAFIEELRTRWNSNFNVYNVQLSYYGEQVTEQGMWPALSVIRNEQYQVLNELSGYYLTVSMDVGYKGEIDTSGLADYAHPKDKKTLGERVAKQALAVYYDKINNAAEAFSPVPSQVEWNKDGIILTFDNAGSSLKLAADTGNEVKGFRCVINEVATDVSAEIMNGNQIKLNVEASTVSAVQYAMFYESYLANANLCNEYGLPAPAFEIRNPGEYTTTKVVITGFETTEKGWLSAGVSGATAHYSYDGSASTKWNPEIADYTQKPGITYNLNKAADISKLQLTFGSRKYYFTLYASTDGSTYTEIAKVTADNCDQYYTDYVCSIPFSRVSNVTNIRLVFDGSSDNNKWVNLFEISLEATVSSEN